MNEIQQEYKLLQDKDITMPASFSVKVFLTPFLCPSCITEVNH